MTDRFTLRTKLLLVSLIFFSAISVFYFMHSQHNPIGADFFIGLRDGIIGTTVGIWFFGLIFSLGAQTQVAAAGAVHRNKTPNFVGSRLFIDALRDMAQPIRRSE